MEHWSPELEKFFLSVLRRSSSPEPEGKPLAITQFDEIVMPEYRISNSRIVIRFLLLGICSKEYEINLFIKYSIAVDNKIGDSLVTIIFEKPKSRKNLSEIDGGNIIPALACLLLPFKIFSELL